MWLLHWWIISGSASPRAVCGYCTGGLSLVVQARGLYVVTARVHYLW